MTRFGLVLSTLAWGLMATWAVSSVAQERDRSQRGNQRQRSGMQRSGMQRSGMQRSGMQRPGMGGHGRPSFERMAKRFDANNDGKITRQEFTGPKEMFGRMDRNGDGKLTAEELSQGTDRGRADGKVSDDSRRMSRYETFPTAEPAPGQAAPNFELRDIRGKTISLNELLESKPVVLEFGSFT